MPSCLVHTGDESVTLSAATVKRLLDRGDGDAALLYLALLRRQGDVLGAVKQHPAIQYDAARIRLYDTGNAAQGHAFAAAGCAQNGCGGAARGKVGVKGKAIQLFGNVHFKTHARPPAFCFFSSRFTASSTTAEITISTSTQRMAPASSLVRHSWYTVVAMVAVLPGV